MRPLRIQKDGNRYCLWPIRLRWIPPLSKKVPRAFFSRHGWHVFYERVPVEKTGSPCMPGIRSVFGQTFRIGRLGVLLGPTDTNGSTEIRNPKGLS